MEDFNTAGPQRTFELIPANTMVTLQIKVRLQAGNGGWLRRSKDGSSEGLDLELTVTHGEYAKRKIWVLFTLAGTDDGHIKAAQISGSKIRAMLESARSIRPDDTSEAAVQARRITNYGELNGLRFMARIGVLPATSSFKAKNVLDEVITPDRVGWQPIDQTGADHEARESASISTAKPASTPTRIGKPAWAV
jgi:hypothetical protein